MSRTIRAIFVGSPTSMSSTSLSWMCFSSLAISSERCSRCLAMRGAISASIVATNRWIAVFSEQPRQAPSPLVKAR
jgi:hypothetical protein